MTNIKTKDSKPKMVKTIDKSIAWTERVKDSVEHINEKSKDGCNEETNALDYGDEKIKYVSNRVKDEVIYASKKTATYMKEKSINYAKNKYQRNKLIKSKAKNVKGTFDKNINNIKLANNTIKKNEKVAKETAKASKRALEQGKRLAIKTAKNTVKGVKVIFKASVSAIKAIISAAKSLIGLLTAGGATAAIIIVIICFVGLLATSCFGIFLSSEKTSKSGITMKDVVMECNKDFEKKLEDIQIQNPHDEYILDGNMASWKDILLIYTVKQSKGNNEQEVITVDNAKKDIIKQIFWDMNEVTSEVKTEMVKSSSINTNDVEPDTQKNVLHIYIKSKSAEEMKIKYAFSPLQIKQYDELSSNKFSNLWNNAIFGSINSGEYVNWRQTDPQWTNIRVGNSSGTLGSIGCLITSISILIEKSGCNNTIKPFNPGTFLEALNKNNGFDGNGNLQYGAITKAVPSFKFIGKQDLRGKSKEEKLSLIKQYLNSGYYLTAEVKGATKGNQHWVAVTGIDGESILMVDPGSNQTIMWNAYNYEKTSQFNYFKSEG